MERIDRNTLYMEIAELMAQRSLCGRAQVGAVIVKDNRIISTGYNGPPAGHLECKEHGCDLNQSCQISIHAEANAIYFAAKAGISVEGSVLYCSYAPCTKCAEAIIQSGIRQVIYAKVYRDEAGLKLLYKGGVSIKNYDEITL
jgi:dCMP deaminase